MTNLQWYKINECTIKNAHGTDIIIESGLYQIPDLNKYAQVTLTLKSGKNVDVLSDEIKLLIATKQAVLQS